MSISKTTRSGRIRAVSAGPAGGSGEIRLRWDAVANVTGYRVLRANAQSGPFTVSADLDITTGKVTVGSDVTNVWSQNCTYLPSGATAADPDPSPWFEYVELVSGGAVQRYFRVVPYNAKGDAAASVTACGSPPGRPAC